jgi:hypothetical protein
MHLPLPLLQGQRLQDPAWTLHQLQHQQCLLPQLLMLMLLLRQGPAVAALQRLCLHAVLLVSLL